MAVKLSEVYFGGAQIESSLEDLMYVTKLRWKANHESIKTIDEMNTFQFFVI